MAVGNLFFAGVEKMRTLITVLLLCNVVKADETDSLRRYEQRQKIESQSMPMGTVPVKYHEQFGPYKLWVMTGRSGFTNFEARFVTIKNGNYIFGLDDVTTGVTKTKQMRLFAIPMKRFNLQVQEELRKEFQKRQTDMKEKRVTYPEPPAEVAVAKPVAVKSSEKPKEHARWGQSYRRINGKLVPIEIPLNKAAEAEVKKELEKDSPKPTKP